MANAGRASPASTVKLRNNAFNFANSLAAHCRGEAPLHPRGLAAPQGLSGRAWAYPAALYQPELALFPRQLCPLPVGACIAGPPTVRGNILGSAGAANAGRASPAPTVKSRNSAYNHARTLAAHCRGGALLHPRGLAVAQGFANQALLAPTIESQRAIYFLRKPCLLLVGACIAGPPTVHQTFGTPAAHLSGRKHFPIAKKDPQTKPFAGLSSWCTISGSV